MVPKLSEESMAEQLYEMKIVATGVVHDADGNIVSQTPVETTVNVTEAQIREMIAEGGLTEKESD